MTVRVRLSPKSRRAQIVRSATEVIAQVGFTTATFARIAEHAGLSSKGLISHHFEDRDELMREVAHSILHQSTDYVRARMDGHTSPAAALNAYITATVEFHARFPRQIVALNIVRRNMRLPDGTLEFGPAIDEAEIAQLELLMRRAQVLGEMASFDTRIAAASLRRVLEGVARELRASNADPSHYAAQLVRLFTIGTSQEVRG